jgi:hypothetical protein
MRRGREARDVRLRERGARRAKKEREERMSESE